MTTITVHIEAYENGSVKPGIVVDQWEGQIHLDTRGLNDHTDPGWPSMSADDARALAAVLIAQANASDLT